MEYLVALKRFNVTFKRYCRCGVPATERTVTNGAIENRGRAILFCTNSDQDNECKFVHMLPKCFRGRFRQGDARKKVLQLLCLQGLERPAPLPNFPRLSKSRVVPSRNVW